MNMKERANSTEKFNALCAKISDTLDYLTDSARACNLNVALMKLLGRRLVNQDPLEKKLVLTSDFYTEGEMSEFNSVSKMFKLVKTLMTIIQKMRWLTDNPSIPDQKMQVLHVEATIGVVYEGSTHLITRKLSEMMLEVAGYRWVHKNLRHFVNVESCVAEFVSTDSFFSIETSRDRRPPIERTKNFMSKIDMDETELRANLFIAFVKQFHDTSFASLLAELSEVTKGVEWPPKLTVDAAPKEDVQKRHTLHERLFPNSRYHC